MARGAPTKTAAVESKPMRKVLLIEDDGDLAEEIVARLADQRFEVEWASNGPEGLKMARESKPDALIVDRRPPGLDGLGIIERLRKDQIQIPILVLSGLDAVEDRVLALRAGGDDYLTKPFALIEFVARLDALLRRPCDMRKTILRVGTLELDLIERTARRSNRQIKLLPREFRLLEYMMRGMKRALSILRTRALQDVPTSDSRRRSRSQFMPSKEYLTTAQILLRVARSMTDPSDCGSAENACVLPGKGKNT